LINYFKSYSSLGDDRCFCVTLYMHIQYITATNVYTSFKQCFQDDVSVSMNFIKHVLTEFIELYPTSKLSWPSNKICPSFQHFS